MCSFLGSHLELFSCLLLHMFRQVDLSRSIFRHSLAPQSHKARTTEIWNLNRVCVALREMLARHVSLLSGGRFLLLVES